MRSGVCWLGVVCLFCAAGVSAAQEVKPNVELPYSRRNTFTIFAEYGPTSSHILAGGSRQRETVDLGFGYSVRLARFRGAAELSR